MAYSDATRQYNEGLYNQSFLYGASSASSSSSLSAVGRLNAVASSAFASFSAIVVNGVRIVSDAPTLNANAQSSIVYTVLEVPIGVTASAIDDTSVLVSWQTASGANWYEIERDGRIVASTQLTEYTDTGLTPEVQVSYRVRSLV